MWALLIEYDSDMSIYPTVYSTRERAVEIAKELAQKEIDLNFKDDERPDRILSTGVLEVLDLNLFIIPFEVSIEGAPPEDM